MNSRKRSIKKEKRLYTLALVMTILFAGCSRDETRSATDPATTTSEISTTPESEPLADLTLDECLAERHLPHVGQDEGGDVLHGSPPMA